MNSRRTGKPSGYESQNIEGDFKRADHRIAHCPEDRRSEPWAGKLTADLAGLQNTVHLQRSPRAMNHHQQGRRISNTQ